LPERRRAKVLLVTPGDTYLEAALLLDEYLDVTQVDAPHYSDKTPSGGSYDVVIFDGATPEVMPRANALYIDPRGTGAPVKVEEEISQPGFDHIDRKHPVVRFTALDDVNIARGHKLVPQTGDKVVGASEGGPILVAGQRAGFKFVALGFDVRESDLALRVAWPLFLMNTINWFTDEDAGYISSFKTGEVWRIPVAGDTTRASLKTPSGVTEIVPVREGRAIVLGEHAGFYELTPEAIPGGPPTQVTSFAANLLDSDESAIEPASEITVDGKSAGKLEGFHVGVRREIWIYLLLAALILTAIEWATYHRRITV
jgi:Ca-activated chloride channel family protein